MLLLKDLYVAVEKCILLNKDSDKPIEVVEAMLAAKEYLTSSRTFEYEGKLEMNGGNIIKLTGIQTDLDDVIRALNGGVRQVEFDVFLCLVVREKPVEVVKAEHVAA